MTLEALHCSDYHCTWNAKHINVHLLGTEFQNADMLMRILTLSYGFEILTNNNSQTIGFDYSKDCPLYLPFWWRFPIPANWAQFFECQLELQSGEEENPPIAKLLFLASQSGMRVIRTRLRLIKPTPGPIICISRTSQPKETCPNVSRNPIWKKQSLLDIRKVSRSTNCCHFLCSAGLMAHRRQLP
jgi:hypothetical protein